jgi:hypothetical protein
MYRRCGAKNKAHYAKLAKMLMLDGVGVGNLLFPSDFLSVAQIDLMTEHDLMSMTEYEKSFLLSRLLDLTDSGFDIVTIHDCFGARPKRMNMLRKHYINIFAELAASNILSDILSEITGEEIIVQKLSNDLAQEIARKAEYALS